MNRRALVLVEHDDRERGLLRERISAVSPPEIEVLAAATAEEALGILYALRDQNRTIEMVIAKQAMPGIPGTRLLEIINAQRKAQLVHARE